VIGGLQGARVRATFATVKTTILHSPNFIAVVEVRFPDGQSLTVQTVEGQVMLNGLSAELEVTPDGPYAWQVQQRGRAHRVLLLRLDEAAGTALLQIDGRRVSVALKTREDDLRKILHSAGGGKSGPADIKAPMPGLIRGVKVAVGQTVQKGDALLVLEAMKMENVLKSPRAGTVQHVAVAEGDAVEKGALLLRLG